MSQDHEDGTVPTIILRADMTLCVDITAQTIGDITVDIAAQTIGNIDINIAAQGADVTIDIEAQSVGVYIEAEWESKEGNLKLFSIVDIILGDGSIHYDLYTVPTGKTLYVHTFTGAAYGYDSADREKNQIAWGKVYISGGADYCYVGGNGGFSVSFSTPLKFSAGTLVGLAMENMAGHTISIRATMAGYEV